MYKEGLKQAYTEGELQKRYTKKIITRQMNNQKSF